MGANVFIVKSFQLFNDGSVRSRLDESCNVKIFKCLSSVESYQSYFLHFKQFFFCAELWVVILALGFRQSVMLQVTWELVKCNYTYFYFLTNTAIVT